THLGISPGTLRKYYRRELDTGIVAANMAVAGTLFKLATKGENVTAMIFWLKCRAHWHEKDADGGADQPIVVNIYNGLPN
ncbi:hypothetical protein B1B_12788, partial [mine drainage metagenome]